MKSLTKQIFKSVLKASQSQSSSSGINAQFRDLSRQGRATEVNLFVDLLYSVPHADANPFISH